MAVNAGQAAALTRSAINIAISPAYRGLAWVQTGYQSQASAIAHRLQDHYGNLPGFTLQNATAIARDALRGIRAAELMQSNGQLTLTQDALPVDRQLFAGDERYRYATVVHLDWSDGSRTSYQDEVRTDVRMNADQVRTIVEGRYHMSGLALSPLPPSYVDRPTVTGVSIEITGAGRRG